MDVVNSNTKKEISRMYRFLMFAGIIMVAFNLRPSITSVGPVIGMIRDDIGLSNWSVGIITSLPLLAFAFVSPIAPKVGNRFSNERALLIGLILLLFGIAVRSVTSVTLLYVGTLFVGMGIAFCNVLLPGVIKEKFPKKVEVMTGIYSTAMGAIAATASGLSIPIAKGLGLGWQIALLVWAIPAVIGIVIWIYLSKGRRGKDQQDLEFVKSKNNQIWRSPLAWQVACFMGFQSFLFYVTISWLPEIIRDYGASIATAGWMLSFMQVISLPFSFLVPVLAARTKSQGWLVWLLAFFAIAGYGGLLFGNGYAAMIVSVIFIGIALGGIFPLALAFLGMRSKNARQAAELSGMAQSLGYLLAAIGPIFIGYLYDITHNWTIPLITLIGVAFVVIAFGSFAGRDKYVLD
ncbi:MFS transporter [Lentibacillus sp. N15]|uniref:CynX/NimT family MFS transporter n=1 Tax=Lentibacillus songyuanensis TaxID=3136161 RepID=UPI0031B9EC6E